MTDDVKKVLAMVPQGHKADHAQLWAHLQILASHIDGEDARRAAAVAAATVGVGPCDDCGKDAGIRICTGCWEAASE